MKRMLVILCLTTLAALLMCVAHPPRADAFSFKGYERADNSGPIAVADFTGDGVLDILCTTVTSAGGAPPYLWAQLDLLPGPWSATSPTNWGVASLVDGSFVDSLAAADLNGDGKQDVVVANEDAVLPGGSVGVLLGDGAGGFGPRADYEAGNSNTCAVVGDLNGDGKLDIATTAQDAVSVLFGDGSGGFGPYTSYTSGTYTMSVEIGDFNGDGKADLACTQRDANGVGVWLGTGGGAFGARTDYPTGKEPAYLVVGDVNHDGKQDLVVGAQTTSVLLGNGDGTFAAKHDYGGGGVVRLADMNGDGWEDVVCLVAGVSVFRNLGGTGFAPKVSFYTYRNYNSLAICDYNGDQKPDLLVSEHGSFVSVIRNTTTPAIASLKPTQGKVGTTVTIIGSPAGWSFGGTRGTAKVYIGGKAVTKYVSWSKYQIKVRVPSLAKGKKAVTVKTPAGRSNVKYFTVL